MKLFGTPPSHFTRKVRIVLKELSLEHEFIVLDKIQELGAEKFADNPLHQFPVLEDQGSRLIDSQLICEYLLKTYGHKNPGLIYLPNDEHFWKNRNILAVINGGMDAGVSLIRAKRSEIPNHMNYIFFKQEAASLEASLLWLEKQCPSKINISEPLNILDISLICFYQWARFRELTNLALPNLENFVDLYKNRPSFSSTHPAVAVKT